MDHLTLDGACQKQIFQILAGSICTFPPSLISSGILHLGNVTFIPSRDTEGESEIANGLDSQRVLLLFIIPLIP